MMLVKIFLYNITFAGSPAPVSCGSPGLLVVNKSDLNKRKSTNFSQLTTDREFFRLSERAKGNDKKVVIVVLVYYAVTVVLFIVSVFVSQFPG